jgi:hypothetical protein
LGALAARGAAADRKLSPSRDVAKAGAYLRAQSVTNPLAKPRVFLVAGALQAPTTRTDQNGWLVVLVD